MEQSMNTIDITVALTIGGGIMTCFYLLAKYLTEDKVSKASLDATQTAQIENNTKTIEQVVDLNGKLTILITEIRMEQKHHKSTLERHEKLIDQLKNAS
jgi:glutamine synthetase type III